MRMAILQAKGLVKRYRGRTVVDEVSFHVHDGEIVGLLGRNGAGKTTSFRMTMGMVDPDAGAVVFQGKDVTRLPMYQRAQRGMGYLAQEPSIFGRLSVEKNLLAILETRKLPRKERRSRNGVDTERRVRKRVGVSEVVQGAEATGGCSMPPLGGRRVGRGLYGGC